MAILSNLSLSSSLKAPNLLPAALGVGEGETSYLGSPSISYLLTSGFLSSGVGGPPSPELFFRFFFPPPPISSP